MVIKYIIFFEGGINNVRNSIVRLFLSALRLDYYCPES